jgi:hypothetical protein
MSTADACRITKAKGFWRWLLVSMGAAAITMPWRTVYVMEQYLDHEGLVAHEKVHIRQIDRDGAVVFSAKYLWWLGRHGYWDNPYEVEAHREAPLD